MSWGLSTHFSRANGGTGIRLDRDKMSRGFAHQQHYGFAFRNLQLSSISGLRIRAR